MTTEDEETVRYIEQELPNRDGDKHSVGDKHDFVGTIYTTDDAEPKVGEQLPNSVA